MLNIHPRADQIAVLTDFTVNTISVYLSSMKDSGYCIPLPGLVWTLTEKGEYFLRGIEVKVSRIVEEVKLSPWKKVKKGIGDPREKYLMPAARKGKRFY